jgi:Cu/Ag efflux pump CusA
MFAFGTALRFRFLILGVVAALPVFGGEQLRRMPTAMSVQLAPPELEIPAERRPSVEVKGLTTFPIEQAPRGVPNVEVIRSRSALGLSHGASHVTRLFTGGTDLMEGGSV